MPVTILMYTEEPVVTLDQSFADEVLHFIPFCRGKSFTGETRYTHCVGREKPGCAILINDPDHHSEDLYMVFRLNGGDFYYRKGYDHPINTELAFWAEAMGTEPTDPQFTMYGDVILTFKGQSNFVRSRILENNQRASLRAVK